MPRSRLDPSTRTPRAARAAEGERFRALGQAAAGRLGSVDPQSHGRLRAVLWEEVTSEYDARFLSQRLRERSEPLSPAFREVARTWAEDELRHHLGFLAVYEP